MSGSNSLGTAALLPLSASGQSRSDIVSAATGDFYRFTLTGKSSLNLSLTGLSGNADLRLLNGDGTIVLNQSLNQGALSESINRLDLQAGTYVIKVSLGAGSTSVGYSLNYQAQNTPYTQIAWRYYGGGPSAGQAILWQIDGSGNIQQSTEIPTAVADLNWRIVGTGDFNRDGQSDLVWQRAVDGDVRIWTMDGANLLGISASVGAAANPWKIAGAGDFNHDGQSDLVMRNQNDGDIVIWFMSGATLSQIAVIANLADQNWQIQGVGDFDRDGKSDLVWRNQISGENAVWFMNDTHLAGIELIPSVVGANWQIQGVGDFSGDGKPDLLWRNMAVGDGTNLVWRMDLEFGLNLRRKAVNASD
jgi:Bacterial pre-peptidase C-terminal domain/FG-GAP-like repeat